MRLVDADELKKSGYRLVHIDNLKPKQSCKSWADVPTAYDVEKVVGQLQEREETSKECYVEAMTESIGCSANRFCGERFAYNNAIEIVRSGGVE